MKNKHKKKIFEEKKARRMNQVSVMILIMLACIVTYIQPVFATNPSGAAAVTEGIGSLIEIVKAFVSSVGAIIVLWGLFEWGNAMQSTDGAMQSQAFKRIGGGIIMTLGPQIFLSLVA